jgi:S-adenosylmethionine/arginine decarboxylase-like enzyme
MKNPVLIHKHLIIRAEANRVPTDEEQLSEWLKELTDSIGMKILMGPYVKYCTMEGNRGITGIAVIETSHIAIHVWDEPIPALMQIDVYSCAEFDPYKIAEKIKADFDVVKIDYKYLNKFYGYRRLSMVHWSC